MRRMRTNAKVTAVIAAGGSGTRMGGDTPKQFLIVGGKPMLAYTIAAVSDADAVDDIILAVPQTYLVFCSDLIKAFGFDKVSKVVCGGENRQHTVYNALKEVEGADYIAVCDGARPLVRSADISRCIKDAVRYDAAALGVRVSDTLKRGQDGFIAETIERDGLWQIQTPQVFLKGLLLSAHQRAMQDGVLATDDCALVERLGHKIKITEGSAGNMKITTPADLALMEALIDAK